MILFAEQRGGLIAQTSDKGRHLRTLITTGDGIVISCSFIRQVKIEIVRN